MSTTDAKYDWKQHFARQSKEARARLSELEYARPDERAELIAQIKSEEGLPARVEFSDPGYRVMVRTPEGFRVFVRTERLEPEYPGGLWVDIRTGDLVEHFSVLLEMGILNYGSED